jgi:diacylglycerol kinase family enzyme
MANRVPELKLAVVLNRRAGTLFGRSIEEGAHEIEARFARAGASATVTIAAGRASFDAIRRAAKSDAGVVVVGGGDGTVRSAAHIVLEHSKTLGILPLGTVNLLARDLGIPFDLNAAIDALATGEIRRIDVGAVNGRIFLSTSGLGFFAHMAQAREEWRSSSMRSKWIAFAGALWTALARAPDFEVDIDTGDGLRAVRTRAVLTTNNIYEYVPGLVARRPRLDGGELALHIARHQSRLATLRAAVLAINGGWQADPGVETIRTGSFTVLSDRSHMRVSNDGELDVIETPLRYHIRPRALAVLAPRAESEGKAARDGPGQNSKSA